MAVTIRCVTHKSIATLMRARRRAFSLPSTTVLVGAFDDANQDEPVFVGGFTPTPIYGMRTGSVMLWSIDAQKVAPFVPRLVQRALEAFAANAGVYSIMRQDGKIVSIGAPATKPGMTVRLVPFPDAVAHVDEFHSHLSPAQGAIFSLGIEGRRNALHAVAMVGRPVARRLDDGRVAEITRVASDRTPHAASKVIAAAGRACLSLGFTRVVSYTLSFESGTSYRAAGWWPTGESKGGEWTKPSRERRPSEQTGRKIRWEFGPDALAAQWDLLPPPVSPPAPRDVASVVASQHEVLRQDGEEVLPGVVAMLGRGVGSDEATAQLGAPRTEVA